MKLSVTGPRDEVSKKKYSCRCAHHDGVWGREGLATLFLHLDNKSGSEWSASRPGRFTPIKKSMIFGE